LAPSGDDADVRALVAQGKPIAAIALVRERRRCSLREAKDIVDAMR
jgi:ribosomal protein L7/L12